ncbi:MAG: glycosyltransferase family 2 protein [Halioglobus sp.]
MPLNTSDLPCLSVAIVVYNSSLSLLAKTLSSLSIAAEHAVGNELGSVEVTIVDNGSTDDYSSRLGAMDFGSLEHTLLRLPENRGFGAGHNRANKAPNSDYHLVLNPDVELAPDVLSVAISTLREDKNMVLVSPYSRGPDGQQEFLCKRYPSVFVLFLRAFTPGLGRRFFANHLQRYEMSDVCADEVNVEVPLASGCFMLVRSDQFAEVGGFDEQYFLYFEDFDLSMRLRTLGRLMYVPSVRIVHHGGYAASKGWKHLRMFASSGSRFFRQHGWRWI